MTEVSETAIMVAISLYRGNLHRVPEVPRRWLMPSRAISMKDFRCLLRRRSQALSHNVCATTSNPNLPKVPDSDPPVDGANCAGPSAGRQLEKTAAVDRREGTSKGMGHEELKCVVEDPRGLISVESSEKAADGKGSASGKDSPAVDCSGAAQILPPEKPEELVKPNNEVHTLS